MKIALLANLKKNAPGTGSESGDQWDELDAEETIESILAALRTRNHHAEFFEASIVPPYDLVSKLMKFKPEMCFNIAEGHFGDSRESQIPALLEMLRLPYTGSGILTLTLALDKPMTKRVLSYHDLPTPEFQVFGYVDEEINDDLVDGDKLRFPLFLKPSREGTGMGITGSNIVETVADMRSLLRTLMSKYNQPILCERFIRGRELTVGLVGNLNRVLPDGCDAKLHRKNWEPTAIFRFLQAKGNVAQDEMDRVFNNGIGYCLVVRPDFAGGVTKKLQASGQAVHRIGTIVRGSGNVKIV